MKHNDSVPLQRQKKLQEILEKNPFVSDEQLASLLNVSIHTIRADRRRSGIPEVRKRGGDFADTLFARAKSLSHREIVGELLEIELDHHGLSLLDTTADMGLSKSGIIRGHVLFAQANTLANAIVDAEVALTAHATVEYLARAYSGQRLLAKAQVVTKHRRRKEVHVIIKTKEKAIFQGSFTIYCLSQRLASYVSTASVSTALQEEKEE
ncbi:MAG: transcription factor FapR [Chitinivibrionales bacterium]|nr:transcription factor FapR [Chitinivibrionales bacterium]